MAYTAQELITHAYYLSNVKSRELNTPTGSDISNGLRLLNSVLDMATAKMELIPYYEQYFFSAVPGQEEYYIPGLVEVQTLTFDNNEPLSNSAVRFPMDRRTREEYRATLRPQNIRTLPYQWFAERKNNGTQISIYFLPDRPYPFVLNGKFNLSPARLNTDLSIAFQGYFLEYLRYATANLIAQDNGMSLLPMQIAQLDEYERKCRNIGPEDLTSTARTVFSPIIGDIYVEAGYGRGFFP